MSDTGKTKEEKAVKGTGTSEEALPKIDFATFVLSLSHSVLVHMGEAPGIEGESAKSLTLARQTIDLLGLLEEKTKGNLTGDEERLLSQILFDLRMRFVDVSKGKKA